MPIVATNLIQMGHRFREDYRGIPELCESIVKFGIIQPLVVDRDLNLIAGGRRLTAARSLGLAEVPIVFRDQVDELTHRELELEENLHREDLLWPERIRLTAEIDRLKRLKYGSKETPGPRVEGETGWSMRDTAQALDMSVGQVSKDITLARMLDVMPELAQETSWTNALKKVDKELETLKREWEVRQARKRSALASDSAMIDTIWHGDCLELIKRVPAKSVDCIIIDPPYGTEAQGDIHFDDSPEHAMDLLSKILPELSRVAKENAHVWLFYGIKLWNETIALVNQYFEYDPVPAVWIKDTEGLVDFDRRMAHKWEPILFCSNGSRHLKYRRNNVFEYDAPRDRINTAEKPEDLIAEFINLSTQEGELILDTFSGSGVVCATAKKLKRHFIGIELDKNQWNASILRLCKLDEGGDDIDTDSESAYDSPIEENDIG